MKQSSASDQTITRYLLNDLSEEEQTRFEEAYLGDGNLFEQLQAMEEELIEDYLKGELSGRERDKFEQHYLASDQRRAKIETARQLLHLCSLESPTPDSSERRVGSNWFSLRSLLQAFPRPSWALGFGAAAAFSLLLGVGLVIELSKLRGQLATATRERAALEQRAGESERQLAGEREQLTAMRKESLALREELENLNNRLARSDREQAGSQASGDQIYSLVLTPGIRKIGQSVQAVISPHTSFIDMQINMEIEKATTPGPYRVSIKTVEGGREIWTRDGIRLQRRRSSRYVAVRVPVDRFKAAGGKDFTLTLSAPTADGKEYEEFESYYFQVISK